MALNWTEIGTALGTLITGAGAGYLATKRRVQPLEDIPPMPPITPKRRASDLLPCTNCTVDEDMSDLRKEVNEGLHSIHTRLNAIETAHEVQSSKAEDMAGNISELFTLMRQLSADVNKTLGKLEIMNAKGS